MIRYHISLFILLFVACIVQQFLPAMSTLFDARVLLLHLVFLCGAVTVGFPSMLALAFVSGFLWDAGHVLGAQGGHPEVYDHVVPSLPFGYSILLFVCMGVLMQGVQPLFRKGTWQVSVVLIGIALSFYLLSEYTLITLIRGEWLFPGRVFIQIWITSSATMICAPFLFLFLFKLAKWFHFTIRYDGLKRYYFTSPTDHHKD